MPVFQTPDWQRILECLEGMSIVAIKKIVTLSRTLSEPIPYQKLINLFRYGDQKSPWEDLDRQKVTAIKESLAVRVKGQDFAIEKVSKVVQMAFVGLSGLQHSARQDTPKGTLFFVGPTGVGKTELARLLRSSSLARKAHTTASICPSITMNRLINASSELPLDTWDTKTAGS